MHARLVPAIILTSLLVPLAHETRASSPRSENGLPNIVYILADDMGPGDVSALNEKAAWKTPHMDRLAAEGMKFTDAHSGSGVCTPTRYGIITGRYAWRTRLKRGVLGGSSTHLIDPARMTVATYLKAAGYRTGCIGKWHLGMDFGKTDGKIDFGKPVTNGPDVNGFDEYYCHNGSLDMAPYVYVHDGRVTAAPNRVTENKDYHGFWRKGQTGSDFEHVDVLPNFTRKAVRFIETHAKQSAPFFLYLPLPAPHTPIVPTEEFLGKSKTNVYGDFVLQVDDTVGKVMQALESAGVTEDTLLIVTADNGCSPRAGFPELAKFGHHPSHVYRGYKADIYEGGHRVPFLVRWPRKVKAGTQSAQTICLTDLFRTCADIVGKPLPDDAGEDSVSLLPALLDSELEKPLRHATIHHSVNGSFAIRSGKWKLILCPGSGGWSAPKPAQAYKQGGPLVQLFDLEQDIGERNNLAEQKPDLVRDLIALLEQQVTLGRSTEGAPQKNTGKTPFLPKGYPRDGKQPEEGEAEVQKEAVVYKTAGETQLALHVHRTQQTKRPAAAIVFFFGGGWNAGKPSQFFPHCEHLARKGMVAIAAEYRVKSRHGATPFDCLEDAFSAITYVREHANALGIDPQRIAAGGGSAGGHLAAATATVPISIQANVSPRPNALVLFNPVFDNGPEGYGHARVKERYREISPIHNLKGKQVPPTIVFLGTQDKLIPVATARKYEALMHESGNRCDLHLYEGQKHGFFNHRKKGNQFYAKTVREMDRFLTSLGYLRDSH